MGSSACFWSAASPPCETARRLRHRVAICHSSPMRAPNFYAHPGFERAGLRRRDNGWILERIADPGSLFVPVWRNQNLVFELDDAEPRAVVLPSTAIAAMVLPA